MMKKEALALIIQKYHDMVEILKKAEAYSDDTYLVRAKWSKILSGGKRVYSQCYGPPFIMQFSGSGLVAPCGMLLIPSTRNIISAILQINRLKSMAERALLGGYQADRFGKI